jgi:lipid A 3-O-deacylase
MRTLCFRRRVRLFVGMAGLMASGAASGAAQGVLTQSPDEGTGAPLSRPARVSARSNLWQSGIGSGFRKGALQAGLALGVGIGNKSLGSRSSHDLALATARFGWVFNGVEGHGWYRGNPELVVELWGGSQVHPTGRTVFGLTPLLRYNFATGSRWVPFVNGGVGIANTNIRDGDLSTGFEFNVQVGAGAHYFWREDTALTVQYRWFHLSNAGIKAPNNGTNTQLFFAGLTWFR